MLGTLRSVAQAWFTCSDIRFLGQPLRPRSTHQHRSIVRRSRRACRTSSGCARCDYSLLCTPLRKRPRMQLSMSRCFSTSFSELSQSSLAEKLIFPGSLMEYVFCPWWHVVLGTKPTPCSPQGRYLPVFASAVYDSKALAIAQGHTPVNLKSVMIGNGATSFFAYAFLPLLHPRHLTSTQTPSFVSHYDMHRCQRRRPCLADQHVR